MRLNDEEYKSIIEVCKKYDEKAQIYLFGSRTDDEKRGGDIDLLIFSNKLTQKDARLIKYDLWDKIGEQKIDIVITKDDNNPFVKVAFKGSVKL